MRYPMLSVLILMLSLVLHVQAQKEPWNSVPSKGFVFQISNKEAQKLLTKFSPDTIFNGLLHTLVDTFDIAKGWTDKPAQGHFILTQIDGSKLHCEYTNVFPYEVLLLKEYNALALQVLDREGNVREDALVRFGKRRIRMDLQGKTYRLENEWVTGRHQVVTVELEGFRSVFNIEKHEVPTWYGNNYYDDDGPSFYSYMITDKNRYKPGENVRFKSYALSQGQSPLRKTLEIWLRAGNKSFNMGEVNPHRPGSYVGEFVLHDSLKLVLDKPYSLELRERRGRIVAHTRFKYEDYELDGNKLHVSLDEVQQYHPAKNTVSITATDINGLLLKDARAFVVVKPLAIRETFQPLTILHDTLLYKELRLDADGPTTVDIASDLFQKTNTSYEVVVAILNSQNQRLEESVSASHIYSRYELTTRFSHDSIVYEMMNNGVPMMQLPATLQYNGETTTKNVQLPYREKINPVISKVKIESAQTSREVMMTSLLPRLELEGGIRKDSFNVTLFNPQKLEVSWYIYQGNELIDKGFGAEINHHSVIMDRQLTYYVELLYTFGGVDQLKRKEFEFKQGFLDVTLHVPDRVYPGQKVEALIQVNDEAGVPVNGVDLTAMAVTAKLGYAVPTLPYYGTSSSPRSRAATYTKSDLNKRIAVLDLQYHKWEKLARLDTMMYYKFIYPGSTMFRTTVKQTDKITQFAPYVISNGMAKPIHVIEVNAIPIYFSWVNQPEKYSFEVSAAKKHLVTLRLYDRVLILDSLKFEEGVKTILSIDLDHLPPGVKTHTLYQASAKNRRQKKYPRLTATEVTRYNQYMAAFTYHAGKSYLESQKQFVPLYNGKYHPSSRTILAGPIVPGKQTFHAEGITTTYEHAGLFTYTFEDNIVYKQDLKEPAPKRLYDGSYDPRKNFADVKMTRQRFLEDPVSARSRWLTRAIELMDVNTRVSIQLPEDKSGAGVANLFFRNCMTGEMISPCRSYLNSKSDFYSIPHGCFNVIVLYGDGSYLVMENVNLSSYIYAVINLTDASLHPPDDQSFQWLALPAGNCYNIPQPQVKTIRIRQSGVATGNVRGVVYDEQNEPLPGCNIVIKGTTTGTVSDEWGRFALDANDYYVTLVVSFIGYASKEIEVRIGTEVSIALELDVQQLSEVVVTAYGVEYKSMMVASMSTLLGSVAGADASPDEERENSLAEEVNRQQVEQGQRQLYQELLMLNSIRSNFSDVGFWEPKLFTDRQGQSRFTITFPDDITRWDATIYAMNRSLQTGTGRKDIKSYKPIMAELSVPQFLTRGDSAFFIGKILNYSGDPSIAGKVSWKGAQHDFENDVRFTEFHTDYLPVQATADSVKAQYVFTRDDGYMDGEERTVQIGEQGIMRAEGTLSVLKNNDEVDVHAHAGQQVEVEIFSNPLNLYEREVYCLVNYKYLCNEQLASKLVGLINYKLLMRYEGKPFRHEREVEKIINRLLKNQNQEFLWSWWDVSPNTSYWMSAHILRALKSAQDAGYRVNLDVANLTRKIQYKFDFLHADSWTDSELLNALASWKADIDYKKYLTRIDSAIRRHEAYRNPVTGKLSEYSRLTEKLLQMETRLMAGLPCNLDSLLRYKKEDILGSVYFTDNKKSSNWHVDGLSANAIAYRIIKRDPVLRDMQEAMQLYFIANRRKGIWNTYQSSNIVQTILPDLLEQGAKAEQIASVNLSGAVTALINKFPYKTQLQVSETMHIRKDSGVPLYLMEYVHERVTKAKRGGEGFQISTSLGIQGSSLVAGKPVTLTVKVDVSKNASAEYVMVEIPIPASCSYADKNQPARDIETHREYFKDHVAIFCEQMSSGSYTFEISLLPRFTGKYIVNPAQVSLMYVPVINANTDMKTVKVY